MKFNLLFGAFIFLCFISFSTAGISPWDKPKEINYSLIPTVNDSQFLQGLTPQQVANLAPFNSTQFISNSNHNISWLTSFINNLIPAFPSLSGYLFTNGSNAEQNINLNNVNLTNLTAMGINLDGSATYIYEGELVLDGNGDYVETSSTGALNGTNALSVSVWVKSRDVGTVVNSNTIVSYILDNTPYSGFSLNLGRTTAGKIGYYNSVVAVWKESSSTFNSGNWEHVVIVDNGSTMSWYKNGVLDTSSASSPLNFGVNKIKIGYERPAAPRDYNGSIDEVQIFNRTLSQAEITNIYNLNRTAYNGSTIGLVAYYGFDGTPNDFSDSSGNGNDGTSYGNAYTNRSIISVISNGFFTLSSQTIHYWNDLVSLLNLVVTSDLTNYRLLTNNTFTNLNATSITTGQVNATNTNIVGNLNQTSGNATINNYYGEAYNKTDGGFETIDLTTPDVYKQVTKLISGNMNGFSVSGGNLTTNIAGLYNVKVSVSVTAGGNSEYGVKVFLNETGQDNCYSHAHVGLGNTQTFTIDCFIRINSTNNKLTVRMDDHTNPVSDPSLNSLNLNAVRIGN